MGGGAEHRSMGGKLGSRQQSMGQAQVPKVA